VLFFLSDINLFDGAKTVKLIIIYCSVKRYSIGFEEELVRGGEPPLDDAVYVFCSF